MKLICELMDEEVVETVITEGDNGVKNLHIKGTYLQSAVKNRNGRIYATEIMENAVNQYIASKIQNNCAYGELNHPNTPQIDLERASHLIKELNRSGNDWIGSSLILNTPMGNIARGIVEGGGRLGVSSRGMGTLKKGSFAIEVQPDFRLSTAADIVSDPSAPDAFVNGVMEGTEWVWNDKVGWQALQLAENIKEQLNKNARILTESDKFKAFQVFINHVKNVSFGT